MSLFSNLSIGRSSLFAHQRALETVAQNVANVDTPGYSRQRTRFEPDLGAGGAPGGVAVAGVEQVIDRFLEARRLEARTDTGNADTRSELLDRLQQLFPVDDSGVGGGLSRFFDAARALGDQPESAAARQHLLEAAGALASGLRNLHGSLSSLQREADDRLAGGVADANVALTAIADLNRRISASEVAGQTANDLRDQRRQALQSVAENLQVRTVERGDGRVDVYAADGQGLVLGDVAKKLELADGTTVGLDGGLLRELVAREEGGGPVPVIAGPGGRLGALLGLRDDTIPDVASDLDALALTLRDGVNAVHAGAGAFDQDGAAGTALFGGSGAADLSVLVTDPRKVAASQNAALPSDNRNALALSAVENTSYAALGNLSLRDFNARVVGIAGSLASDAGIERDRAGTVQASVDAEREAVSGVSLEQEFTDMIRFQRGFQAASQLIVVSNELLDELMGIVR